MFTKLYISFSK